MKFRKLPTYEVVIAIAFGLIALTTIFITSLFIPNPSQNQIFVFRLIISLGAAGVGAVLPGFLLIQGNWNKFAVRAGGALALFFLVYFFNPAA